MGYTYEWRVTLDQVDTSGRIFHARAFEAFHAGIEALVSEALDAPYPEFYEEFGVVTPVVNVEADFHGAIEFGHTIVLEITPELGDRSIRFVGRGYHPDAPGEALLTIERTQATLDLDSTESIPVPDGIDELFRPYMADSGD